MQVADDNVVGQVAWFSEEEGGPKYLYKRSDSMSSTWRRAYPATHSSKGREAEFATFQSLRRQGYCLVNRDGSPILDGNGNVVGNTPLPAAKSNISIEHVEATLSKLVSLDASSIQEGEVLSTRLLTLPQRMSLIKLNEHLEGLTREELVGYAMQAIIKLGPSLVKGTAPYDESQDVVCSLLPSWLQSAKDMGTTTTYLTKADKGTLLSLLKEMLPYITLLEGMNEAYVPTTGA